jgi:hypothetical protein
MQLRNLSRTSDFKDKFKISKMRKNGGRSKSKQLSKPNARHLFEGVTRSKFCAKQIEKLFHIRPLRMKSKSNYLNIRFIEFHVKLGLLMFLLPGVMLANTFFLNVITLQTFMEYYL